MLPFIKNSVDMSGVFKADASVRSNHKVVMEWNFNAYADKESYGCYTSDNNTYSSTYYDSGTSKQFFNGIGYDKFLSSSASEDDTTLVLVDASNIVQGQRVSAYGIPADTYVTNVSGTTITISNPVSLAISTDISITFYEFNSRVDSNRATYTPIESIFDINRPDPGIIHLIGYSKGTEIIDFEKITFGNFGGAYGSNRLDRVYPIYKTSKSKYWSSVRKIATNNVLSTVGISESNGNIDYARPFIAYKEYIDINKLVIKTQKYQGYPVRFSIDLLTDVSGTPTWTTPATLDFTSEDTDILETGILNLYYTQENGWSTTPSEETDITLSSVNNTSIKGIRFNVSKMSAGNIPLEVIEISPRLVVDITAEVMAFKKNTAISTGMLNIPVGGVVSGTMSLSISNISQVFSEKNNNSILAGLLYQGVEARFYEIVEDIEVPLGTYYINSWNISSEFEVTIEMEDYFSILKRTPAPDIAIFNTSGIETSVALLILLDNAGITNYEFVKQSATSNDDYVIDYFYSNYKKTLAEVLNDIAISSQVSIFIDANNIIKAVTKEKMTDLVAIEDTDYWFVGSEDWSGKPESTYLNNIYKANISSLGTTSVLPVTDATIVYNGYAVKKESKEILTTPEIFDDANNAFYNASIVGRNIGYVTNILWDVDSTENGPEKTLLAAAYLSDISNTRPNIINEAITDDEDPARHNDGLSSQSQYNLIRTIYQNSTEEDKKYFEIVLDAEMASLFMYGEKFNGHVLVDSEIIKYNGLVVNRFDSTNPDNSGTFIVFNKNELSYLFGSASANSSIICYSILVELNYVINKISSIQTNDKYEYTFVSDGRGANNTTVSSHIGQSDTDLTNNRIGIRLYSNSEISDSIKAYGTISATTVNLKDPRIITSNKTVTYPGYFKISGPKDIKNLNLEYSNSVPEDTGIPVDTNGEAYITGFYKSLGFTPQKISTRMRLLAKPLRHYTAVNNENGDLLGYTANNRGIAGISFRTNGKTGYFLEIEDVGNITKEQLQKPEYSNMRLYKVKEVSANTIAKLNARTPNGIKKTSSSASSGQKNIVLKNVTNIEEGMYVSCGSKISDGTFISSISGNTITLNNNIVTTITSGQKIKFFHPTVLEPERLGRAWVNVSAVAGESQDFGQSMIDEGQSYAGTSDVSIVIEEDDDKTSINIYVYWEGQLVFYAKDTEPISGDTVGLFVRSDSEAMFEYIMAAAVPENGSYRVPEFLGQGSKTMSFTDIASRGIIPSIVAESKDVAMYFEDFGKMIREARNYNVNFDSPTVYSSIVSLTNSNPDYYVSDYSYSSSGANFWVFNTSRASIGLSTDKRTPLIVYGIKLEQVAGGEIKLTDFINKKSGNNPSVKNILIKNKDRYGSISVSVSGEYINSLSQAEDLMQWLFEKSNTEKKEVVVELFANPLLELGDKIRIFYSDMDYQVTKDGITSDAVYYVTSISYNVDGNGPKMSVNAREV